jgi:hypothetical protein
MTDLIQIRRDTTANWSSVDPVLAAGEPALDLDTGRLKHGDGATAYSLLPFVDDAGEIAGGSGGSPTDQIPWFSGAAYFCPYAASPTVTATGLASGVMHFVPFPVSRSLTISAMRMHNSATGTGSYRVGVYDSDPTTKLPATKLFTAGVIVNSVTVGAHDVSTSQTLSPDDDPLWLAYLCEVNNGNMRGIPNLSRPVLGKDNSSTPATYNCVKATGVTTGSLPSSAPSVALSTDLPVALALVAA